MKNQLVKAEDFGIEEKQERELLAGLPQIKKERDVLEEQYSKVILLDVECPDSWKKARELRLLIQKNRTQGINAWHKNAKDYFLKGGQFVDAIKRKESAINERMESQLMEIEKFEEIQRKRKIDELNQKRIQEIEPYSEFVPFGVNLGEMDNEDYTKLFNGAKMQFDAEQERLRVEEAKRIEDERINNLHNERKNRILDLWRFVSDKDQNFGKLSEEEFDTLHADLEAAQSDFEKEQERIRKENERLEKERAALEAERKREREEAYRKKKELEEKARKEREEAELKAKKEREEREKLEAKIKAEKEAERKRIEEERAEQERLRKAPIKEQMKSWIDGLSMPNIDVENEVKDDILNKFESFKKWALNQIENI